MGQLLVAILILAAVVGVYRCSDSREDGSGNPSSRQEETLQTPRQVEQAMEQQVGQINRRNRDLPDRN